MIQKIVKGVAKTRKNQRESELIRKLMRKEAEIGGQLFGPVPQGHRREFFCLDEYTWVWHEEWVDAQGQHQIKTTRYDVRPNQILKSQNGNYQRVSKDEALRLREAVQLYKQRTKAEIYHTVAPAH